MSRLSRAALAALPPSVRRPSYDLDALRVGHVHVGLGAFSRCFLADFVEDALESGAERRAIAGLNLFPPALADLLAPQDGIYTRTLVEGDRRDVRVIGGVRAVVDARSDLARAVRFVADPAVDVVTMTVTEKGYCHIPATGLPDPAHAGLAHDAENPEAPQTLPGLLLLALDQRLAAGGAPITLMSCDNVSGNGAVLRSVLTGLAERRGGDLARYVERSVAFPSTMVDRIVPAADEAHVSATADLLGVRDEAAVFGEPFRQWVIEDCFAGARPRWDAAGAAFVADVEPYEAVKMRILNATQTVVSVFGMLMGLTYSSEGMRTPALEALCATMHRRETWPSLQHAPGMAESSYWPETIARIRNRAIRHRCTQIVTDTSQKIVQRLLAPIRAQRAAGGPVELHARCVGAWLAVCAASTMPFGARWTLSDPHVGTMARCAAQSGPDPVAFARAMLDVQAIFGDLAADADVVAAASEACRDLLAHPAEAVVKGWLE